MPTEAQIVDLLKRDFAADAAIVVGSRADGLAHDASDWDIYVLIDDGTGPRGPLPAPRRFDGIELDIGIVHLPVPEASILRVFGPNLQQARVLFDASEGQAGAVVHAAGRLYAQGCRLEPGEIEERRRRFARNLAAMKGRKDDAGAFFEAVAYAFYSAHRLWYELKGEFSQSVHRAMKQIADVDPCFYSDLLVLASSAHADLSIAAAERIQRALFGDDV
jgi:hypothetical protein